MVPVGLNRPRGPPTVGLGQTQLNVEGLCEVLSSQCVAQRTSGHDLSAPEQHDMRDSGRNLLHVVGDEDRGWCVVILGELAHHWFEAAPLGTLPRAIECATLAENWTLDPE